MELARSVMEKIGETFANFESKASSMSSVLELWRKLQSEFATAEASMAEKERALGALVSRVESLLREVVLRKQRVDLEEMMLRERVKEADERNRGLEEREREVEKRCRVLKDNCCDFDNRGFELRKFEEELNLREKMMNKRFEEVEVKEKKVNDVFAECQRTLEAKKVELVAKHRRVVVQQKNLIEERKKLEVKEKELDKRCREVELKEKALEMSEGVEELELKRREVDDRFRQAELKEKEVMECSKRLNLMKEEVEKKERGVAVRFRELEDHEKRIMESRKGLELMKKDIDERFRVVELKEIEMSKDLQALDLRNMLTTAREKQVNDSLAALKVKVEQIEERSKGIKLRLQNAVELREKQLKQGLEALEVKVKEVEECCEVMNATKMELISRRKELELRERSINEVFHDLESNNKKINDRCQSLELKEKRLNEGLEALELKKKEFDEECGGIKLKKEIYDRWKVVGAKEMELISRQRALELKEQSVDASCQSLELKEKEFDEQCQSLKLKAKELNEGFQAVELKERKLEEEYKEMNLKKKEIDDAFQALEVKEKQIRRRHRVLDLREQQIKECCKAKEIKVESSLATSAVASSFITLSEDIQSLCKNMNAKGLRSYLLQHVKEYDTLNDSMLDSLQLAAEPAKLVLDVLKSLQELEFEEVSTSNFAPGCINLLVNLMKLRVYITFSVKDEAMKFSDIWRLLLRRSCSPLENFGYLLYLASFNLAEIHDADELLSLFTTFIDETEVCQPELVTFLCGVLGLRREIADIIQTLISGDKQLLALRYIVALQMECDYPLIFLLRAHLQKIDYRINEILKLGDKRSQGDAKIVELTALKEVLECISSFKLESSCSHVSLELRNNQLEKEREESEGSESLSSIKRCSNLEKESVKNMPEASNSTVLPSEPQIGKKRSANSEGWPKEEKHPRMHTHHGLTPYNPSRQHVHVDRYQHPVLLHRTLPPVRWPGYHVRWPGYHLHPYQSTYGVPYNTSSGAYAWNQVVRK